MTTLTSGGEKIVADLAKRHDVSEDAITTVLDALKRGNGQQAQFNHPDLGGMGQWSSGGMTMLGDMFNADLKAKVEAICSDLSRAMAEEELIETNSGGDGAADAASGGSGHDGWPDDLGTPSSTGSQNAMRYAVFPESRRLAIDKSGEIEVYDTGDHRISGVSQQQSGDQSLSFVSQNGTVNVADLKKVS